MYEKLLAFLLIIQLAGVNCAILNDRPIIGIVTEEFSGNSVPLNESFIMSYYVKFVEASGARVVPVLIYKSEEYYRNILSQLNGILLTGGGDLLKSPGYGRTGKIIYDIAVEMNDRGSYFPVWGTCLGFEMLTFAAADKMWLKLCSADNMPSNIHLEKDYLNSKMFSNLSSDLKSKMEKNNVTIHLHHWCLTPQNFSLSRLNKIFKVLALEKDFRNQTFISIVEALKYPFYGVSFHPEKVLFDWSGENVPYPHSAEAVETSQFFGNFFIGEARKNFHQFPSEKAENSALIYNYNPKITGDEPSAQMYVFQ